MTLAAVGGTAFYYSELITWPSGGKRNTGSSRDGAIFRLVGFGCGCKGIRGRWLGGQGVELFFICEVNVNRIAVILMRNYAFSKFYMHFAMNIISKEHCPGWIEQHSNFKGISLENIILSEKINEHNSRARW